MDKFDVDISYSDEIYYSRLISCPLALLTCLVVAGCYSKMPGCRVPPARMIIWRFSCAIVYITAKLFSAIFKYYIIENILYYSLLKAAQTGMICWTVASTLDVIFIVRNPFKADRYFKPMHFLAWFVTLLQVPYLLGRYKDIERDISYHSIDCPSTKTICTMQEVDREDALATSCFNLIVSFLTVCAMLATRLELRAGLKFSEIGRQRVVRSIVILVVGFAITDIARAVMNLMVPHLSDEWKGTELWKFDLAQNLAVVWDCFAWMVAMSVHKRIGDWAQHREEDGIDFAVEVRHELVLQTALGICHCASQSAMKYSSTKNLERRKSMEFSSDRNLGHKQWGDLLEASLSGSLSLEEVKSNGFSAEEADQIARYSSDEKRVTFEDLCELPTWVSDNNLERAKTIKSSTGGFKPFIPLPWEPEKTMDFYDYDDAVFAAIRQRLGVTAQEYKSAFETIVTFVDKDKESDAKSSDKFDGSKFKEIVSSGASGSYFYFTPCRKFIVKQIDKGEKDTLRRIVKDYFSHTCVYPQTTIHYYGLYSIRLPLCSTRKIYFVVMKNFMYCNVPHSVNLTFDLKGATFNRQKFLKGSAALKDVKQGGKGSSLLDWDWMHLKYHMDLKEILKRDVYQTIRADLKFLAQQQLLDYSLLLGITSEHRPALFEKNRKLHASGEWGSQELQTTMATPPQSPCHDTNIQRNPMFEMQAATQEGTDFVISADSPATVADIKGKGEVDKSKDDVDEATGGNDSQGHKTTGGQYRQPVDSKSTGEPAFCFGMIDILETWNCGWAAQGWVLWLVCTIFRCLGNPQGITAIDPLRYAWRFDEFVQDKILDISDHDTDMNGEPTGDMNPLVYDGWRDQESQSWRPWK